MLTWTTSQHRASLDGLEVEAHRRQSGQEAGFQSFSAAAKEPVAAGPQNRNPESGRSSQDQNRHPGQTDPLPEALVDGDPAAAVRIETHVEPGAGHLDVDDRFYDHALTWLSRRASSVGRWQREDLEEVVPVYGTVL